MKFSLTTLLFVSLLVVSDARQLKGTKTEKKAKKEKKGLKKIFKGRKGVCVVGCTPYVNPDNYEQGILKWKALVEDMASQCDVMIHVGDTKAGAAVCTKDLMTGPIHTMVEAGKKHGTMVLYSPGDNELNDCHRDGSRVPPRPADFYKAADARQFLIDDLDISRNTDLTGAYAIDSHVKVGIIPGTSDKYSCDFDKYAEFKDFAVATLEIMGSQWYLADQSQSDTYPNQDTVDPLANRLSMYLNAKDCALEWITMSATKASAAGLSAVFFNFQAHFWTHDKWGSIMSYLPSDGIGEYYNTTNLARMTKKLTGEAIEHPFQPLYEHLTATAFAHPHIMFYVVHADSHVWVEERLNSYTSNIGDNIITHHNLMMLQVEGDSRALTMFAKLTVDPDHFNPVTAHQIWSESAYNEVPIGHSFYKYS